MTGKTHLTAGILAGVFIAKQTGIEFNETITCCVLSSVGSLLPDIDLVSSKLGSKIKPVSKIINTLFGHRTLFHAPIIYTIIYLLLIYFFPNYNNYFNYFFVGILTHLFLDSLNKKGIPLLYPFYRKRTHFATIKTNGKFEYTLNGFLILFIFIVLFKNTFIENGIVYCFNSIKNFLS